MAIKIGITGGIGSGKSVVSRLLEIMGIPVYISDIEAKRITHTNDVIRPGTLRLGRTGCFPEWRIESSFISILYIWKPRTCEKSECCHSSAGERRLQAMGERER